MQLQIRTIRNKIMPKMTEKRNSPEAGDAPKRPDVPERVLESRDLLAGTQQVLIRHDGRLYRLQRTRSGKLILTA